MTFPVNEISVAGGLWIALFLGIGFGIFLEQGGMGDARKISAQFYLRDLAVMKVMFSAVVTAALGLFWFAKLGWLDYDLIFVPPTYVWPQILGGIVFGAGFVTGGLCPGTSCVAVASGRLDGLALLFGLFVGIFLFNEFFDYFEEFYRSGSLGSIALPEYLGVSTASLLVGLVVVALALFLGAEAIERRDGES